jgi:hypothetical protein
MTMLKGLAVMLPLLTEAVGGAAIEIFIQQDHRPYGHAQGAFRDQPRRWWCRHDAWNLRALTYLLVAWALDATNMGLHLGLDHGVGHPLLLLYDVKAPNGQNNNEFKGLYYYPSDVSLSTF